MYRQQISQKAAPSPRVAPINPAAQSPSYGSLSGVVQRVQQDPDSMSRDERQQLESAIGSRATREILAGKQTRYVPDFRGISGQMWGDAGQVGVPIQAKGKDNVGLSRVQSENKTGLPDDLKTRVENLSGYSLDNVRVHYNSSKPAELQALAYTQGTDIHVAPGQEKHLPHEVWHVVQQMQGRVKPTMQMKGVGVNDDAGLEREADVMGVKAADSPQRKDGMPNQNNSTFSSGTTVQRLILKPGTRKQILNNTYKNFPAQQLRDEGLTQAELELAREYHEDDDEYYTLAEVRRYVQADFQKQNQGVRVKPQQKGTKRLRDMEEVIDYYDNLGIDTTTLEDKFVTKKHAPAFDAVFSLVPLTEEDLSANVKTSGDLAKNFVSFINQTHVPDMVRTPSMIVDISTSMEAANTGTQGFVSSNKGSMFEQWVAQNVIASSGKIDINKQGTMNKDRSSDGYSKAKSTLYDAKNYDGKMAITTNDNQYDDYKAIVKNGYTGSNGEVVTDVCYIFPTVDVANANTHLKYKNKIHVAYPKKGGTTLQYV
jgi:hypothetical protein